MPYAAKPKGKRNPYQPERSVMAQSADQMVGTIGYGRFVRQDLFELLFDTVVTDGLESIKDYLGPSAPDWSGIVIQMSMRPPDVDLLWQWPDDGCVVLNRKISHGLVDSTRIGSSLTHGKEHLADVAESARQRLKTSHSSRAEEFKRDKDGKDSVRIRDLNEEEKKLEEEGTK